MMKLPEGFSHVGDGRLSIGEEQLAKLKTPRDIGEVYLVEETWIAKGMYGIVRSAISKQSGISYAAKFLRRRRRGQCCLNEINHEIAVLMLCADSDHVVKLQAVHETRSEIALILELATGGELQTLIDEQGHLSEQKTRVCMREILRALQHMHSKSIAHLDLKPQNILLAGKTVDDGLKLCDFGIARFIAEKNKIYEIVGTPDYVAPEVLHYDPLSLQTDIWSIGVVAYVLLTGLSPFGGDSKQETFLNVTKCSLTFPDELFDGISSDAIDFIKSALRIKPKERLTVDECLEHRWLKEKTVCLREELLAARATLSRNGTGIGEWDYSTTSPTTTLMGDDALLNGCEPTNGDGGGGGGGCGGGGALVLENGSSNGCNVVVGGVVRPHEAGTKQQQQPMLAAGSNNGTVIAPSEEKPQCDAGAGEGGGDESDEGGGTASPPALAGELRPLQRNNNGGGTMVVPSDASSASTEDNKENVIVVGGGGGGLVVSSAACALFPDAPTTPKVSRKALPVEPLNDGGGLHYNLQQHHHHHHHLQHHNHHHHHHHSIHLHQTHHHHHHHNHLHHSNGANSHHVLNASHQHHANQAVLHPAPPNNNNNSGGVTGAASGGPGSPFVSRQGSPSCVKKYIQKMHLQQQLVVPAGGEMATTTTTTCKQDAITMVSLEEMESKIVNPSGTTEMAASSSNGGDVECCDPPEHASSFAPATPPVSSSSNGCSSSSNSNSSNSSCRTTVAAGAALCALNCTEASSVGGADSRHLASPGHKTLQQCEKDAIIC
ncbi:death-associated protein kinase related-like isoform X1 [Anopheles arabiensis]|uniref:non-specific serine/threonine protein kinase n=1 Tax=Anopheles arabiensis TaxID=7173 RepID=A0A2C9GPE6_ANOAR|nr:death-associated protein kinase related-like isoform X1 [Anopheles arabiensis]